MKELTYLEKAWIFELVEFIQDIKADREQVTWNDDDILERIYFDDISQTEIESVVNKLHDLGWSKHREHDVATGLPIYEDYKFSELK